ncbi:MAG TPA: lytic transglycosylase domain-containing protein [Chitinophagaceae bacterium]|jgi:membrane-bound lytic murein transglycosylase D|nr:lytic transglycosylase domain-containing protein [Chitinophagaceae bacterium]
MLKSKTRKARLLAKGFLLLSGSALAKSETGVASAARFQQQQPALLASGQRLVQLAQTDSDTAQSADTAAQAAAALPVPMNAQASSYMQGYLKKNGEWLQKVKDRSPRYFEIIDAVFEKQGLPLELRYLAVVESKLHTTALSPVGARGPWQLMPATAKELGLKISGKRDDRTHYYKSTSAAAHYLKSLYAEFGDWLLVLAAYNAGPGNVHKAIRKAGSRNFWRLQGFLPPETRLHVKRFISVHYFFEGKGSLATLTRSETLQYRKEQEALLRKQAALTLAVESVPVECPPDLAPPDVPPAEQHD